MFNLERWQEIFEAISKNKLRTFLTGLSVGSGIFILIILLGIAEGMKNGIGREFEKDASTLINFWGSRTSKEYNGLGINRKIEFSADNYDYLNKRYAKELDQVTASYTKWELVSNYKDKTGTYPVIGAMPGMQAVENIYMNVGRFLSDKDIKNKSKVVVVGIYAARDFFDDYTKAVGETITIDGIHYKVIGVYSDPGGERDESKLFIPNTNVVSLFSDATNVGSFLMTLNPEEDFEVASSKAEKFVEQYTEYLKKANIVHPDDDKAVQSNNTLEHAKKFIELNLMIKLFFWGIGILTLIAGIVSVSNIMLIIVKERTKEIGIRKALGAQPNSIIAMILHESIFVTALSGFIGLFFGVGLLLFISPKIETPFIYNPTVDFGVAVSAVILLIIAGAIAGFIPARHASKIKPIIALRDE